MKKTVMATGGGPVQGNRLTRQRNPQHLDAERHRDSRRQHLTRELGQRWQLEDVVEHPHEADHHGRDQDGA